MCQVGANYTTAILTSYDWRDESANFYVDTAERLSRRLTEFSKKVLLPRSSQVITIQICLPWKQLGVCYSDYLAAVRLCHAKKQRTLSESVYTRLAYSLRKTLWFLLGFDVAGCKKVRGKFRYFHRSVFFAFVSFWTVHCVGVCKIYAVRKILALVWRWVHPEGCFRICAHRFVATQAAILDWLEVWAFFSENFCPRRDTEREWWRSKSMKT